MARLRTESWNNMTKASLESPRHVKNLTRWIDQAKAENPALSEKQATRLAEQLRSDYFRALANHRHHGDPAPKLAKRTDCGCGSAGHGPDECPESAPERAA